MQPSYTLYILIRCAYMSYIKNILSYFVIFDRYLLIIMFHSMCVCVSVCMSVYLSSITPTRLPYRSSWRRLMRPPTTRQLPGLLQLHALCRMCQWRRLLPHGLSMAACLGRPQEVVSVVINNVSQELALVVSRDSACRCERDLGGKS